MLLDRVLAFYRAAKGWGFSVHRGPGDPGWRIGWDVDQVGREETGFLKKQCRGGTSEETETADTDPHGSRWVRGPCGKSDLRLYSPVSQPFMHHGKHWEWWYFMSRWDKQASCLGRWPLGTLQSGAFPQESLRWSVVCENLRKQRLC